MYCPLLISILTFKNSTHEASKGIFLLNVRTKEDMHIHHAVMYTLNRFAKFKCTFEILPLVSDQDLEVEKVRKKFKALDFDLHLLTSRSLLPYTLV